MKMIKKNLYILGFAERETVLFGPKSGTSLVEKRHFFGREVPFY